MAVEIAVEIATVMKKKKTSEMVKGKSPHATDCLKNNSFARYQYHI